ncbi:MAG TPA: hypothetical protein VMV69_06305 [Pirellulales bacterium]|nr:hypothetical protein [Pirellulales bacterium]
MWNRFQVRRPGFLALTAIGLVAVTLGCTPGEPAPTAKPADPDDVPLTEADVDIPATYRDAVVRLRQCRDQIRDAVAARTPGKAHRPLDELEIVLWKMPNIARDDGVPKRHWETVVVSSEELSELFNQVHSAIDAGREPDFEAVAQPIQDALDRLEAVPGPRKEE